MEALSETDITEDLNKFDIPTLILHGDDDQIVPIGASAMLSWLNVPTRQKGKVRSCPIEFCLISPYFYKNIEHFKNDLMPFLEKFKAF